MNYLNKSLFIITAICLLSGAKMRYEYVEDGLVPIDITWEEFTENKGLKFLCGYYERVFKIEMGAQLKKSDSKESDDSKVWFDVYNPSNTSGDPDKQIKITEKSFADFRTVFFRTKCLKFTESDLPVKFFKVRTQGKLDDITFYTSPKTNEIRDKVDFSDYIYYAYGLYSDDDDNHYALLGAVNSMSTLSKIRNNLIGWVKFKDEDLGNVNAVLWSTNIGIRPTEDSSTNLKPLVFRKHKEAYKASRKYFRKDVYPGDDALLVTQDGIAMYNNNYLESNGSVWRWLPSYMDEELGSVYVGVIEDYTKVRADWQSLQALDEIQIAFVVDATNSMSLVWNNLDTILKKVTANIINGGLSNNLGNAITPKIQIWYYNQGGKYNGAHRLTNRWYSTSDDLTELGNKIDGLTPKPSNKARPPMSKAIEYAILEDMDVKNKPTYIIVIGDASDLHFDGQISASPAWDKYKESNFFAMKGIRYKSDIVWTAEQGGPYGAYREYYDIWQDFKNVNFPSGDNDFLTDISPQPGMLPSGEVNRISSKISKSIVSDITELMDVLKSTSQGKKIDVDGLQGSSALSRDYIENVLLKKDLQGGNGTYFETGLLVSQDSDKDKTSLVEIDVYTERDKLDALVEIYDEYLNDRDLETAEIAMRQVLMTFFELKYSQVTDKFLQNHTLNDLWRQIVGNQVLGKKLVPGLFSDDAGDFTFYDFLENLEEHEDQFHENIQESFKNLDHQIANERSMMTIDIDLDTGSKLEYFWVPNEYLSVFKGITIE